MHSAPGALRLALMVVALPVAAADAANPTLSVGAGACRDIDLVQLQAAFSSVLAERLGSDAVEPRQLLARARPPAPPALEELQRQLEGAQARFYAGQHDGAAAQLKGVIEGLERFSAGPQSWKLLAAARVLQGLVLRGSGKKELANEAFRRVLRVDPAFALDPDNYSPTTIAAFEAVRRALAGVERVPLTVLSQPSGAAVFLDGAPVGKTPFSGAFPAGSYTLAVAAPGAVAFPRQHAHEREATVSVDLAFEGSLSPVLPLCVSGAGEDAVAHALKLGAWAEAKNVILLRLTAKEQRPDWLEASLLDVKTGVRIRTGGLRLVAARQAGALDALATYVLTGQGKGEVVPSAPALGATARSTGEGSSARSAADGSSARSTADGSSAQSTGDGSSARSTAEGSTDQAAADGSAARSASEPSIVAPQQRGRGPGPRIAGGVLLGAGAAAGAAGLVTWLAGARDRELSEALRDPQGQLPPPGQPGRPEAEALAPKVEGNTGAAVALWAGGGALAVAGAVLVAFFGPESVQVGVAVTPVGAAASVGARF